MIRRWFTITLLAFGVTLLGFALTVIRQAVTAGELGARGRRRRMHSRIESMQDHFIVCGFGRVGRAVVDEFEHHGVSFVVIESDEELEEELLPTPAQDDVLREDDVLLLLVKSEERDEATP